MRASACHPVRVGWFFAEMIEGLNWEIVTSRGAWRAGAVTYKCILGVGALRAIQGLISNRTPLKLAEAESLLNTPPKSIRPVSS